MKNWFSKLLTETTQEGRNAFRVAVVMIGAALFTLPLDLYLAIQSNTWQMYLILISAAAFLILAVISAALARKNRAGIAMALITGGLYILLPEIAVLISGLGLILSITQVVVIVTIVGQTLSGPRARRALIIGVISAILTLLIDLFAPWKRVSSPALQTEIPYIVAAIILVLGIYFIRNFRDYSVRVKLLLGFLSVVALASSGGVGAILQQSRSAEKTALTEASTLAGTLSSIVISNQTDLQGLIVQLSETQRRDVEVVGPDLRILADSVPEDVGTIFEHDQNGEVAATLKDGQPRTFVEISPEFPLGIEQIVVPVKDEATGTIIIGAIILEYTGNLQLASFAEADSFTEDVAATIAHDPASLQNFISIHLVARERNLVVVDLHSRILADTTPAEIGTRFTHDQNGELAATLQDGEQRSFIEISSAFPDGLQQTITSIKDSAGNIIGATILGPNPESEEAAVVQATQIAETLSTATSQHLALLQETVSLLYETQGRHLEVVGPDLRILADASPEHIGTIVDNPNGEVAATLKDGETRTFVEISPDHPQGSRHVIERVKDEETGKIAGAIILDYTPLYEAIQQTQTAAVRTLILLGLAGLALAFVIAQFISSLIAKPIAQLSDAALKIGSGQIDFPLPTITTRDEIGTLTGAFNSMTSQLRDTLAGLEQRVAERTKALATSAEVSRRLSTILDEKELVTEVVEQVHGAFNYYHAHIYLFNESGDELILAGGSGEAGQTMLAQGHKISRGKGLVGRSAETNTPILVSDTSKNPDWLPNPLLPETRSEVAVPITIGDKVLGVLDVQQNIADGLKQEDVDLLGSLATQVAIALQNSRQFQISQKVARELEMVANISTSTATFTNADSLLQEVVDQTKKAFSLYHAHIYRINDAGDTLELAAGAGHVGKQMVAEGRQIPLNSEKSLVARAARAQAGTVVNDVRADPDFLPNPLLPDTRSEQAVPMIVGDKVIGVLDVQSELLNRFTEIDVNIYTTLAAQVAVALQNTRSFAQSQRQAERESMLNTIGQKIQSATTVEAVLQIAARELGRALDAPLTIAQLGMGMNERGNGSGNGH